MNRNQVICDLSAIGSWLMAMTNENQSLNHPFSEEITQRFRYAIEHEGYKNGWFEPKNVKQALQGISLWLNEATLSGFCAPYLFGEFNQTLGLILAGNIPLVGFHDMLCGLLSGFKLQVKLSSDDNRLLPFILEALIELNPEYASIITLNPPKLYGFDAVIGTGSDSTLLHFKTYFKEIPHLLRGNRTSIAVLTGKESPEELNNLGKDIFDFYGRGCRNVTHLLVPESYVFDAFHQAILPFSTVIQSKKYGNNYDYNRAIHLLSQQPLLDNGFVLLMESTNLHPPLAMVNYHYYQTEEDIIAYLAENKNQIQCVIGTNYLPFGTAQQPGINEFADGINTMAWLEDACN